MSHPPGLPAPRSASARRARPRARPRSRMPRPDRCSRDGAGCPTRARSAQATTSARSATGTLAKKIQRHAGETRAAAIESASPASTSGTSGWIDERIAAPRNGPAAMPRNVSAPMSPRARGRIAVSYRWAAAAVPTGTSTPPPIAWTRRAAISWSRSWANPASTDPSDEDAEGRKEQPAGAPQVGEPAGQRHREDVHEQVAVDDPARLAQLDPGRRAVRRDQVGQDRRQRDRGDHQLETRQEHADAEHREQRERGSATHRGRV